MPVCSEVRLSGYAPLLSRQSVDAVNFVATHFVGLSDLPSAMVGINIFCRCRFSLVGGPGKSQPPSFDVFVLFCLCL